MSINLLIIDHSTSPNWYEIFKAQTVNNKKIKVEQSSWWDIVLQASSILFVNQNYQDKQLILLLKAVPDGLYQQQKERLFTPDIVLIRNFVNDLHGVSYENILKGFAFAGIPSINSFSSVLACSSKPLVYGELLKIQKKLSLKNIDFPLIDQYYYPNIPSSNLMIQLQTIPEDTFPLVAKIGTIHAGMGKMFIEKQQLLNDFQSCIALTNYYYTLEPFVKNVKLYFLNIALQKIGKNYRVYTRKSETAGNWKNNIGKVVYSEAFEAIKKDNQEDKSTTKQLEQIPEKFIIWMDEVSQIFNGLDMFALDVLHSDQGDYIIELNDTAMGLMFQYETEDANAIKDLVLEKCNQLLI